MINVINGETPFQILSSSFSIGPSETGYDLQVGADSRNFTTLFSVGANTPRMVTNVANGSYFRLKNNVGDVKVNWQRVCVNEGGGSGSGVTPQDVQQQIDSALTPYWDSAVTESAITEAVSGLATEQYVQDALSGVSLEGYWTSAETKTYVDSAVTDTQNQLNEISGMMQSKELVISTAFNQLSDEIDELSGRSVDLSAYYTSAQTEEAISAATSRKADAANIEPNTGSRLYFPKWNEQGIVLGGALSEMYNRELRVNGDAKSYITQSNYGNLAFYAPTTSGNPGDILVSTGNGAPVWTTDNKVSSTSVSTIWKGTQAEYDAITTKDPNTFYIIVNN